MARVGTKAAEVLTPCFTLNLALFRRAFGFALCRGSGLFHLSRCSAFILYLS